jgi:hypothetical protein
MSYKKHILNNITDKYNISSVKLNINLMKYYIKNELIFKYKRTKQSRKPLINNINNWQQPTNFIIPDNKLIKTTYKSKSYTDNKEYSYVELLNDSIINNFDSDNSNIKLNVKHKDIVKQITINSINLQLIKMICIKLNTNDGNKDDLISYLLNDLHSNRFVINENYNDNIKIIGIPNIYNTLPFLINPLFKHINNNIDYNLSSKYVKKDFSKLFNNIDKSLKLYNKTDNEYKNLKSLEVNIINFLDNINATYEKIYNLPNFKFEYNFYVLENTGGLWKPKYYHIRELSVEDKPILERIQTIISKLYNKVYNTKSVVNYNNYMSYVSYIDIFNISTMFLHPFDNDKIFYYKIKSKIMLEELINELEYISQIKINLDINNNYFSDSYKIIDKVEIVDNLIRIKSKKSDVYFHKDIDIIYFNASKWDEYEMIYIDLDKKTKYINFIVNIYDGMCHFDVLKYITNEDRFIKILKSIKQYHPIYNYKLNSKNLIINNDIMEKYYPLQTLTLINYYNKNKEKHSNNTNTNNIFKSLSLFSPDNINYKVVKTNNLCLFIQKNKTQTHANKLLIWILHNNFLESNVDTSNKLIAIGKDDINFRDIYDFNLELLLELKDVLNSLNLTSDKFFIYFNKYNPMYTRQLHLHILKKNNYYYYPKHGLNMNISDFQKIIHIDNLINYLTIDKDYLVKLKNNSILLYDNIELDVNNTVSIKSNNTKSYTKYNTNIVNNIKGRKSILVGGTNKKTIKRQTNKS